MSQADQEQFKSMDKKEIAEEEREKMLNAENTKHTGAAPATELESEEQKPKKKIPIGGIKMPGFCRTRSKEPCKVRALFYFSSQPTKVCLGEGETASIRYLLCACAFYYIFYILPYISFSRANLMSHLFCFKCSEHERCRC